MPQSLAKIYVHIVFGTKYRREKIKPEIQIELYKYISGILRNHNSPALKIGGVEDHVHILISLSRQSCISDLVRYVKKDSSKWIKTKGEGYRNFRWQDGYAAFSVNPRQVNRVIKYIENQPEHHKKALFEKEFVGLLKYYNIEFDEKYVWG